MALKPLDRIPLSLSLRTQLVLVTSMLIALAIAVTSLVAISALRAQMVHQLDEEMKTSAPALVQLATVRPSGKQEGSLSTYRVYLLDKDGKVLYSLSSEHDEQAGEPTLNGWTAEKVRKQNEEGVTVGSSSGSADWRLLAVPIEANDSSGLTEASSLIIAMPLKQTNQVVALVGVLTFAFGLATLASAIAMTWVIVTRTFEPLARVEQTAAKIAAGDLSQRIEDYNPNNEIGNLAISLNTMLAQIEALFKAREKSEAKMRRFVGDASHELRTPLAAISGYCELYAMGGVPAERTDEVMGRIASESSRMATLVEDLLTLARLDEGRPLDITDIDLVKLADNAVFDLQALDPTRTVGLTGISGRTPPMTLIIPGDRDRISQVFTNLIGNIVRYTPEGSPVEIALGRSGDTAIVELRDHGPGIDETDRGRVFERFYRADSSRNRKSGGSGLGLAIVSGILAAHRGNASLSKTKGGGLTVRIELPTT